ncbi:hypothetical protein D9M71_176950 [compost metagenome]
MEACRALVVAAGAVLLCQLRVCHLVHRAAPGSAQPGVRLGGPHAVLGLDHCAVLVDRPVVRVLPVAVPDSSRAQPPRPTPAQRAADCGQLLPALAPALYLRAPGNERGFRLVVRRAGRFRQAVQSGALTAHRFAGGALGLLQPAQPGAVAPGRTCLVRPDWAVGIDHLAASLY